MTDSFARGFQSNINRSAALRFRLNGSSALNCGFNGGAALRRAGRVLSALLLLLLLASRGECLKDEPRRISVAIFPTLNSTGIEVWESKYYPYDVLGQKMSDYLERLYKRSPLMEARVLDEAGMNQWLNGYRRGDDMAVQMEMFSASLKERQMIGNIETGDVQLRLRILDSAHAKQIATRTASGSDKRFTLDSPESVFWADTAIVSLPIPFKEGFDLFGLIGSNYKGQRMSRPTWAQFSSSSHWQTIMNAIEDAYDQSMSQIGNVIRSNEPGAEDRGEDIFSASTTTIGRIIAPTAKSTRRRREYIISLGSQPSGAGDPVKVGDILDVMRGDTYVTVDPENPIAVLPHIVGQLKVTEVYEKNSVAVVIKDSRKDPITLKDIVMKRPKKRR